MNRLVVFLGFLALVVAAQPVFMASAGTKLYVEQDDADAQKTEDGGYKLYNSVPTKADDYTVPLSRQAVGQNKSSYKMPSGIPSTWRVLDKNTIQNRVNDTKSALAFAAKMKAKLSQPAPLSHAMKDRPGPVTNSRDAKNNKRIVEKDMEDRQKEIDRANKKKAKKDAKAKAKEEKKVPVAAKEKDKEMEQEQPEKEKKNSIKLKKKAPADESRRVFNLPD